MTTTPATSCGNQGLSWVTKMTYDPLVVAPPSIGCRHSCTRFVCSCACLRMVLQHCRARV